MSIVHETIERAARDSCGRLVAYLASRFGDLAAVEDALSESLLAALRVWPEAGVPANPEAWLLTAARRRLFDGARREKVRAASLPNLWFLTEEAERRAQQNGGIPDERLRMLFVCAHPAIDPGVRTPLMLQAVLGVDASRIASAFLVAPAAMSQRLVRAKSKIRDAGISFELPEASERSARVDSVLESIYTAYSAGWDDIADHNPLHSGLAQEALWLGRLMVALLPKSGEPMGLLSLMLHCEARREARLGSRGEYVPLADQDASRWSHETIEEAERLLLRAATLKQVGRYQLEAAIHSVHSQRRFGLPLDLAAVIQLYDGLMMVAPTVGAIVARAAVVGRLHGPDAGLQALDAVAQANVRDHQPYWAVRAHLLQEAGRTVGAREAYGRAEGLAKDPTLRAFLAARRAECG